jgi:predicted ATPase/DNA-binding CsgD family transcriptional regulator
VGREHELRDLLGRAIDRPFVTVVGPGGIGKTRLVVALAHELVRRRRRVAFVELADVVDSDDVVDAVADQLSVEVVPGASRYEGLVHWLATEPTVLIVDNVEHVVDAAPELGALVDECPGLHLVATSRRALGLAAEDVCTVLPLAATPPDGRGVAAGVQLLLERSQVVHPTAEDLAAAGRIVAGVGGLPLAIELAAFRARGLGLPAVHELLVADLALGGLAGPGGGTARHSDLRACLQWTYRDLDERARAVFRATGAFAGIFDLAALRAVVGDDREAAVGLAALVEHHLVDRVEAGDGTARYTSIPTSREFARELLASSGEHDQVVDAHARFYGELATRIRSSFDRAGSEDAIPAFRRDEANITRAVDTRLRAGRLAEAARIACDVAELATELGREGRMSDWFREEVGRAGRAGVDLPLEAQVWAAYGELVTRTPGTAGAALAQLEDITARARSTDDDVAVLRGLDRIAFGAVAHGDLARALTASREGIELAARLGLQRPHAELTLWHGMFLHVAGDVANACRYGLDALHIARSLGDRRLVLRVGLLFAPMIRTPEMEAEQVPGLAECLELARAVGSVIDEMYVTMQLAVAAGFSGSRDVHELVSRGLELADRTRSQPGEAVLVLALAGAAFAAGDDEVAVQLDAGLRPEWAALATVVPGHALEHYERLVEASGTARSATAPSWPEVLDLSHRYLARGGGAQGSLGAAAPDRLTARERDVLEGIAAGRTNKDIAQQLGMRPKTVMHHCAAIYRKLGVKTRAEATAVALRTGLIDPGR